MNEININILDDDVCCICLEENIKCPLIEYNHCGKYTVHDKCLNQCIINECFVCRKNIIDIKNDNETNIITVLNNNNNNNVTSVITVQNHETNNKRITQCIKIYALCNLIGIGFFLFIKYSDYFS